MRADLLWLVLDPADSIDGLGHVRQLLEPKKIGIHPAGSESVPDPPPGWTQKPALLVLTGSDRPGSAGNVAILKELLDLPWPVEAVSAVDRSGLDALGRRTFEALGIVRVYTKQPGKPADLERPFTLDGGSTIADLARLIHKDIHEQLKFARVWGATAFDGQTVQREHVLHEGDVVELHV